MAHMRDCGMPPVDMSMLGKPAVAGGIAEPWPASSYAR